jgi:hypothetical protein
VKWVVRFLVLVPLVLVWFLGRRLLGRLGVDTRMEWKKPLVWMSVTLALGSLTGWAVVGQRLSRIVGREPKDIYLPGLVLAGYLAVVPAAWSTVGKIKKVALAGRVSAGSWLAVFLLLGLGNLLWGLYSLATFLGTPGFGAYFLFEFALDGGFIFVGLRTLEVVALSYHDWSGGVLRRTADEVPNTLSETVVHTTWMVVVILLPLIAFAVPVVVWIVTGEWGAWLTANLVLMSSLFVVGLGRWIMTRRRAASVHQPAGGGDQTGPGNASEP